MTSDIKLVSDSSTIFYDVLISQINLYIFFKTHPVRLCIVIQWNLSSDEPGNKGKLCLSENVRQNHESWGFRLHVPVLNGTFLQRKKFDHSYLYYRHVSLYIQERLSCRRQTFICKNFNVVFRLFLSSSLFPDFPQNKPQNMLGWNSEPVFLISWISPR